jgi:dTDP-L-rhamnose 4-epimerase
MSNEYRKGDIHHCYADTTKTQKLLNFKPTITVAKGLTELAEWARTHGWNAVDFFERALNELKKKHLYSLVFPLRTLFRN